MKCNVCGTIENLSSHPFVSGAYICPKHMPKIKAESPIAPTLSTQIIFDEKELKGLKIEGLIPVRTYIYLALRIDGLTDQVKPLKMAKFCARWSVIEADVIMAIASLSKKGIVRISVTVSAQAMSHEERISAMEEDYVTQSK